MMELLRGFASGFTAKILIGLLIASFAFWGVSGSIFSGVNTVVQVGETKIDTYEFRFTYDTQLNQLTRQLQQPLTRQQANQLGLEENVLSQVLTGAVLDESTTTMKLGLSEKHLATALAQDPAFQDFTGQFSPNQYQLYLRQSGLSEKEFLQSRKKVAMRNQLQDGTSASYEIPETFLNAFNTFQNQTRIFEYATITPDDIGNVPTPTDAQITEYYKANKDAFRAPEFKKVTLLSLEASDIAKPADITEEELVAAYESRKDNLVTPERRRIEQLVLSNEEEATSISQKLKDGTSFEDVLAELNKKAEDLELGFLVQAELPDENIRNAAFSAKLNQPTEPVDGAFGPVIIRVTEIEEAQNASFEDMKTALRNELALQKAGEEVFALYDAMEDERAAGVTVSEAAEKLELTTRMIDKIDSNGLDENGQPVNNLPLEAQLIQELIRTEPGDDTEPLPLGNSGYVWYEVNEIIPERQKDLDEVRSDVESAWLNEETNKRVLELAETIKGNIEQNSDFNAALETNLEADTFGQNTQFKTSDAVTRTDTFADLSPDAIEKGFSDAQGTIKIASAENNSYIVLRIANIENVSGEGLENELKDQLNTLAANDILNQVVQDMQSRKDVIVNRAAIEQAYVIRHGG